MKHLQSRSFFYCFLISVMLLIVSCNDKAKDSKLKSGSADSMAQHKLSVIDSTTKLAYEGVDFALTTTPIVGNPSKKYASTFIPGTEELGQDEIRVTILGSGDPFVKSSQASASILIEVGNKEKDVFFFDLGAGALRNFTGLKLPLNSASKVFVTHLHTDHVGDMAALVWSIGKSGRNVPVELWGPSGATKELGTESYAKHLMLAHAWDTAAMKENPSKSGAKIIATEFPYDKPTKIYERNGVVISSFPVKHMIAGPVGLRFDYNGRSIVYSGDTTPTDSLQVASKGGVDLLIHETFPDAATFAKKAGWPIELAKTALSHLHTSPAMAGKIFKQAGARMSVIFHLAVDHETVGSVYKEMRGQYDGPVTIAQDLTVFNITKQGVVVRQAITDPVAWPVIPKKTGAIH
jgi:ribonuclease Z